MIMTHEANAELEENRIRTGSVLESEKLTQYSLTTQTRGQQRVLPNNTLTSLHYLVARE